MKINRILLTGDDGYNALGIRVLIEELKDKYELEIAATKTQQSGVGGKVSLDKEFKWGETQVDGVKAVWVDGTPCDTIEFSQGYFGKPFDLVISGINWGTNVTYGIVSSGTFSAAIRAIGTKVTRYAIAMSYESSQKDWLKKHDTSGEHGLYAKYPGKTARYIIEECVSNDFFKAKLININFPKGPTKDYIVTRVLEDITAYYKYPVEINRRKKTFSFPDGMSKKYNNIDENTDVGALLRGRISVTPIKNIYG